MKYPIWKPILIFLVVAGFFALLYPPEQKLKLGLDLKGGSTLTYNVNVPEGTADPKRVIDETIAVLRRRVDPTGTKNLVWRQIAGNRIEIQMALPDPVTEKRRDAYVDARDALLEANLSKQSLTTALRAPTEQRQEEFNRISGGNAEFLSELEKLETAYTAFEQTVTPYETLTEAFANAEAAQAALPATATTEERAAAAQQTKTLEDQMIQATINYVNAKETYNKLENEVLEANITPAELEGVLDLGNALPGEAGIKARNEGIERLIKQHPNRADQINTVAAAFEDYIKVKGPLDDPNDLIALLRGSGVLEFRIAASANNPAIDSTSYITQLQEKGPRFGAGQTYRWFAIADIEKFIEDPDERVRARQDPATYFAAARNMVGSLYNDQFYILLGNTDRDAITHAQGDWNLATVRQTADERGFPAVSFGMDAVGANLMRSLTSQHKGDQMAIVLDGKAISAPQINDTIGGSGIITGGRNGFRPAYLTYLVRTLKAGSLEGELGDAPISIKTTGPQLGQDNLDAGLQAAVWAIVLVAIFMAFYYLWAGLIADFALFANMAIILGVMSLVQATFTLPGIAGIVLTIGMAVDANVLIFERIREELEGGRDLEASVREGFAKAFSTILDANITTLITCLVLGYTASAEVKGFAVTLGIGIIATLFTALFCTRVFIDLVMIYAKPKGIAMLPTMIPAIRKLLSPKISWVGLRHGFFIISFILATAGISTVFLRGGEMLDIEFRSGTQVSFELKAGETLPLSEVRDRVASFGEVAALSQAPGFKPEQLSEAQRKIYAAILPTLDEVKAAGNTVDFEDYQEADVITEGKTTQEGNVVLSRGFSISTLLQDSQAVSGLTKAAFGDLLETTQPIEFKGVDAPNVGAAPVFAIKSQDLGADIGEPLLSANVQEYLGGVAVVLSDLSQPTTLEDIEQRVGRMRLQPAYEELGYRPSEVIGINKVGTTMVKQANGTEKELPTYNSVVVVTRDANTNYAENPDELTDRTGLADTEWNLVRDALQRDTSLAGVTNFSSQVSETMKQQAIVAMILSLLAVVAYIWFRFGSLRYGIAAIAALVHDVAITLGLVAISGWLYEEELFKLILLDPFKIDLAMIAALLTIVGYSLNDTIVVFDRIRENRGRLSYVTPEIVNNSINQTISRTVLTSGTTLLAVLTLYILGGTGVHGFAFAMLIGVVVGTYSSIAIASPMLLLLGAHKPRQSHTPAADVTA
ncbi:protein translocase subunit SecD [Poriferisphaera sp. WC338]|uniref:protein translocase subunit SecD n=1 Tax=Poriferisphaera sp. WC338 TaxID=3425129 RepID=UPI003D81A90E